MMSSSSLSVIFAFADATTKTYTMEPFAEDSTAVNEFKVRLQMFNEIDPETNKKYTNLEKFFCSESGAAMSGIKTAYVITSNITRIYDSANFGG